MLDKGGCRRPSQSGETRRSRSLRTGKCLISKLCDHIMGLLFSHRSHSSSHNGLVEDMLVRIGPEEWFVRDDVVGTHATAVGEHILMPMMAF